MNGRTLIDLRLAVPAASAWLAAAVACGWPVHRTGLAVAVAAVAMLVAGAFRRLVVAAAAAGLALGALAAVIHIAALRSGPVAAAAGTGHARADVVLTLVRDPVQRVGHNGQPFVLADATVDLLGRTPTHSPVLVIAQGPGWLSLLPGQRVRVRSRITPPRQGDDIAAVLLPTSAPFAIGKPPWWQRLAGSVRERLRRACASLPADERGLVPGLVVGDVSAMPASLTDAFRVSGLTHLSLYSGHENSGDLREDFF